MTHLSLDILRCGRKDKKKKIWPGDSVGRPIKLLACRDSSSFKVYAEHNKIGLFLVGC